jgi:hypothetical protein
VLPGLDTVLYGCYVVDLDPTKIDTICHFVDGSSIRIVSGPAHAGPGLAFIVAKTFTLM